MIQLHTLGSLELRGTSGESFDPVLAQPKRLALLAYLVLAQPRGFQRRDVLLALFWPESDTTHARDALGQALRFLRRFLGRDALKSRGADEVGVDPSRLWCDAVAFEERIAAGDDAEALALYRGELLEGFFLSEVPLFERWLDAEGSRLRELAHGAACRLVTRCEAAGDLDGAGRWARRALGLSPYDEAVLRHLLELLDRSGDRASAVREYDAFADRLREDLEVEPAPETRAVVEAIRTRAVPNESPRPGRPAPRATPLPTEPAPQADAAPPPRPRHRIPRRVRFTAVAVLLVLAGGGVTLVARGGPDLAARRIVVIPFENRTGDPALEPVGKIAADWIVQGLARTDVVDAVPSLVAMPLLQQLPAGHSTDAISRSRTLAHTVGAGTAVVGSYYERGGSLEFEAQIIDVRRGRLLHAVDGIRGARTDPMIAIDELRGRAVGAVGFQFDARIRPLVPTAHRPPTYEAYRTFAAGMDARNQFQWRQSLAYFRRAFALDTTFTPALFLAAIEHLNLREFAQVDSVARLLARSRERLPPFERELLEWVEAEVRGDLQGALEAVRRLVRYGDGFRGQVALNALRANRPREATEAHDGVDIERLLEHQSRMWKLAYGRRMTDAYHRLGSHRREMAEARRARERDGTVVEPVLWEMRALIALERVQHARQRLEEALSMPPQSNWPGGEIMLRAADEFRAHGHIDAARAILSRALAWYRALPDSQATSPRHRRFRAATLLRVDSLDTAEAAFRDLAAEFPEDPYYTASVAVALARKGSRRAASSIADTALNRNPPYDFGHHAYERARVAAQLGNAEEALQLLRQAFASGFDFAFVGGSRGATAPGSPDGAPHLDPAFDGLRAHPGFQELAHGKD